MGLLDFLKVGETVADTASAITTGVAGIIQTVKGDISPEDRAELQKLETETKLKLEQLLVNSDKTFREFTLKYEGTAEQVPRWILVLRSIIRPLITILTFGWFFAVLNIVMVRVLQGVPDAITLLQDIPQAFWWILGIILGFWFGGKAGERIAEKIHGGGPSQ